MDRNQGDSLFVEGFHQGKTRIAERRFRIEGVRSIESVAVDLAEQVTERSGVISRERDFDAIDPGTFGVARIVKRQAYFS